MAATVRYNCSYGLNPSYRGALEAAGLRFTGFDADGEIRIAELPGHPFWLAMLFQPELSSTEAEAHPVMEAFVGACL